MLRILHTADWHLGQTLRGYSREAEQAEVLDTLVGVVGDCKPHALIVAGDVFDSANPPAEALRLLYRTLMGLKRASPLTTIILTAGNHDAAMRLEAPKDLLAAIGVYVVGNVRRQQGRTLAGQHLIPVRNGSEVLGHVLAVSYPTAACLQAGECLIEATSRLYRQLVDETREQWVGKPLILTGHLHVAGGQLSEGAERKILIGGENAFPSSGFPVEAAYVALGHLHKPQRAGAEHVRYSGSLIPLSASEIDYRHGVTLVTITDGVSSTQHLELPRPVCFYRAPAKGYAKFSEAESLLRQLGPEPVGQERRPFVQLKLSREDLPATFREDLANLAEDIGLRLVDVRLEEATEQVEVQMGAVQSISDHEPMHFFELAFQRALQAEPTSAHRAIFNEVLAEVSQ